MNLVTELATRFDKACADVSRDTGHPLALCGYCESAHGVCEGEDYSAVEDLCIMADGMEGASTSVVKIKLE